MSSTNTDQQRLSPVEGKVFSREDVVLDGTAYLRCSFLECRLIYRGGPSRMISCYINPNCEWRLENSAAYVMQFLKELGWQIIPAGY